MTRPTVLILCTGNSRRSHMAEGVLRNATDDLFVKASLRRDAMVSGEPPDNAPNVK